jgi:Tfp pilus assembly protein PilV
MSRFLQKRWNQQGVTLLELLLVVAIMTMVFGTIVTMITQSYDSYEQTSSAAENQNQASVIIGQLADDIRHSVDPNSVDLAASPITIRIQRDHETVVVPVRYFTRGEQLVYRNGTGADVVLAEHGTLSVTQAADGTYSITVEVGDTNHPKLQARLTHTVARYNWGR